MLVEIQPTPVFDPVKIDTHLAGAIPAFNPPGPVTTAGSLRRARIRRDDIDRFLPRLWRTRFSLDVDRQPRMRRAVANEIDYIGRPAQPRLVGRRDLSELLAVPWNTIHVYRRADLEAI